MNILKFKTNINCSGCIATVTPFFNKDERILKWNVDTADAQKVLTVETDSMDINDVIHVLEQAGYKAEQL